MSTIVTAIIMIASIMMLGAVVWFMWKTRR